MKTRMILLLAALLAGGSVGASTLYRWKDASGTVRYGNQPPVGVTAEVAEEERREVYDRAAPVPCQELADRHIAVIDREIARVRELKTGLGVQYALTPSQQQQLIMDLLAHRAAMITGRPAFEFRTPSGDEVLRARNELQNENESLREGLDAQGQIIDAQRLQLQRASRRWYVWPWGAPWGGFWGGPWIGPMGPYGPGFVPPRR